ncbi:MAG: ABC transporter permease [Methanobrevibacter sp.]|jgi:hypothetical protein|nr:ABC transporter permease [Candidatus Methanovirga procula]
MSFIKFVFKSSFRKKFNTLFIILGITISVVLIFLYALINGFVTEKYGDTDFMIMGISSDDNVSGFIVIDNKTDVKSTISSDNGNSYIIGKKDIKLYVNESLIDKLKSEEGVEGVIGTYTTSFNLDNKNILSITGFNSLEQKLVKINIIKGRMFDNDEKEIILSKREMTVLNKNVGDSILIANETYNVVGIIDNKHIDSYTSLKNVLRIETVKRENGGKQDNQEILWEIHVKVKPDYNISEVSKKIEKKYKDEDRYSCI